MQGKLVLSIKRQYFLDEIAAGKNIFLTGKAGNRKIFYCKQVKHGLYRTI